MQSTKICSFEGCGKPRRTKGLCTGHYKQKRGGKELRPLRPKLTLAQRFWQKVRKTESCWAWTAGTDSDGYGRVWVDGCMRLAHRVAWEMTNGPIPEGMFLDHRCSNPACVNPTHLRVVTNAQNGQHRTGAARNSNSGIRGVYWRKDKNAWQAYAKLNGRDYFGGYHSTIEAADKAARALRARLHTHDDHEKWLNYQKEAV